MADTLSPAARSARMACIQGRDTKPEMLVRRMLYAMGYRYRLHAKDLPGKPDIVFRKRRKAIFIHGCFWHRHPDPTCRYARLPKSRLDFWLPKLERNRQRDLEHMEKLSAEGWQTLIIWECQLSDETHIKNLLHRFLEKDDVVI
ncbi:MULTISPECIES: very short patch repair endonuclease [Acetobacteraceae]|uniref:Very short patch repair endonuclease n=1 Tax=Novacetimonas cocois TaxID=1747507 RepID=A0A365YWJ7_9PROT|nr:MULTISPECIES: DNA mismatch endonuclease Vsr [Acetobacteraceae]MCK9821578.1 DNA mismatch endonuclease Vsr [Komagataeibacter oboediens]RBM06581.1 very short patch repair endonuclease [Novacetimonas cocois]